MADQDKSAAPRAPNPPSGNDPNVKKPENPADQIGRERTDTTVHTPGQRQSDK